jgi:hypothetical protein
MTAMTVEEHKKAAEVKRVRKKTRIIVQNEREKEKTKKRTRLANKKARKARRINRMKQ